MIAEYPVLSRAGIFFIDIIITSSSYIASVYVRNYIGLSVGVIWQEYMNLLLIIIIVWSGFTEYQEAYAGRAYKTGIYSSSYKSIRKEIIIVLRTVIFGCPTVYLISLTINQFTHWIVPLSLIAIFGVLNFIMLSLFRVVLVKFIKYQVSKGKNIKKVLIMGMGDVAKSFIESSDQKSFKVHGIIGKEESEEGMEINGIKVVGCYNNLEKILHSNYIDELIVALPAKYLGDIEEVVAICDKEGIPVRIVSPFFKNLISKSRAEIVNGLPHIMFLPVERNDLESAIKRLMDIVISLISLVILAPVFLVVGILLKLDSPGPIFYRWRILGLHKRPMRSYKFRTMVLNADELKKTLLDRNEMGGVVFKMRDDPRITRVGKWLRKYSIDELPQLWSVLRGELSLVGPRPPLQTEIEEYEGWHRRKLSVKPGLTCLWQIGGRNDIMDFDEWMRLDLEYVDNWTLWLDIVILFKTIPSVLKGSGR